MVPRLSDSGTGTVEILEILMRTAVAIIAIIALTRINGLRTHSKMSSFDFALTLALGSLLASTIININQPLLFGVVALAGVILVQAVIAIARSKFPSLMQLTDNKPLLLMRDGKMLDNNMTKARITKSELYAKLRESNALSLDQVRAVVLEATGDISVLHSDNADEQLQPELIEGVRDEAR